MKTRLYSFIDYLNMVLLLDCFIWWGFGDEILDYFNYSATQTFSIVVLMSLLLLIVFLDKVFSKDSIIDEIIEESESEFEDVFSLDDLLNSTSKDLVELTLSSSIKALCYFKFRDEDALLNSYKLEYSAGADEDSLYSERVELAEKIKAYSVWYSEYANINVEFALIFYDDSNDIINHFTYNTDNLEIEGLTEGDFNEET